MDSRVLILCCSVISFPIDQDVMNYMRKFSAFEVMYKMCLSPIGRVPIALFASLHCTSVYRDRSTSSATFAAALNSDMQIMLTRLHANAPCTKYRQVVQLSPPFAAAPISHSDDTYVHACTPPCTCRRCFNNLAQDANHWSHCKLNTLKTMQSISSNKFQVFNIRLLAPKVGNSNGKQK